MEKGDLGTVFMCRVEHIALQTAIERRSGELQVTGHQDAPTSLDPESKEGNADEGAPGDVSGSHDGTKGGPSVLEQGSGGPSSEEDGGGPGAPQDLDNKKDLAHISEPEGTAKDQSGGDNGAAGTSMRGSAAPEASSDRGAGGVSDMETPSRETQGLGQAAAGDDAVPGGQRRSGQ
ncbi:S-antigen protein-like [Alligator sinensis]|uniref:S-antigen protein-like n=1 Tax=Alligator sinensis TaxID=38654 RepID=A0A3Q0FZS7_ALLSI|nr:S-antigen protein-like [Alligator sinensis]